MRTTRSVGLRDVARVAGVSTATVSRAINSPDTVSEALRARVASVVRHLGWVPHGAARALATRRTGTIGAVFPTLTHGDFARAIQALQSELSSKGYTLLLACSEYDPEQEYRQVRKLIERGVDALLLVGEAHHRDMSELLEKNRIPYANSFVYNPATHGTCIGPDNRKALYELTRYLIKLGHKTFGVVAQSAQNNDRAEARLQGILGYQGRTATLQAPRRGEAVADGGHLWKRVSHRRRSPRKSIHGNCRAKGHVYRRVRRHRNHVRATHSIDDRAGAQ